MLASGGNDNKLCLWGSASTAPPFELTDHQAAVKALAWYPHEWNLLATGGGTADRTIKFWNSRTDALLSSIDTESQVCALQWNPHEKEILSSHRFAWNQLFLWKYLSMVKIKELEGHTANVLHMACSPNGGTVVVSVSAAANEILRFWDVFALPSKTKESRKRSVVADFTSMKFCWTMQLR
jgi:cell division cycle protein 20 (cofactor of APC complex)